MVDPFGRHKIERNRWTEKGAWLYAPPRESMTRIFPAIVKGESTEAIITMIDRYVEGRPHSQKPEQYNPNFIRGLMNYCLGSRTKGGDLVASLVATKVSFWNSHDLISPPTRSMNVRFVYWEGKPEIADQKLVGNPLFGYESNHSVIDMGVEFELRPYFLDHPMLESFEDTFCGLYSGTKPYEDRDKTILETRTPERGILVDRRIRCWNMADVLEVINLQTLHK